MSWVYRSRLKNLMLALLVCAHLGQKHVLALVKNVQRLLAIFLLILSSPTASQVATNSCVAGEFEDSCSAHICWWKDNLRWQKAITWRRCLLWQRFVAHCSVIGADRDRKRFVGFIDDVKDLLSPSFPEKLVELDKLRSTRHFISSCFRPYHHSSHYPKQP